MTDNCDDGKCNRNVSAQVTAKLQDEPDLEL